MHRPHIHLFFTVVVLHQQGRCQAADLFVRLFQYAVERAVADDRVHHAIRNGKRAPVRYQGVAPGAVIKVLQPGYELFGRIVRPAMVVVASKTGAADAAATPAANPYADADGADAGGSVDTKA